MGRQVGADELGQGTGADRRGQEGPAAQGGEGDGGVGGGPARGDRLVEGDNLLVGPGRGLDELEDVEDGQPDEQADGAGTRARLRIRP